MSIQEALKSNLDMIDSHLAAGFDYDQIAEKLIEDAAKLDESLKEVLSSYVFLLHQSHKPQA